MPGLAVTATGSAGATTGVFPRGGESNYTLVLIDGVPANSFGGDFDFGHLSTANVDRIEVVRGPQSALFGSNAIGAVVRISSRRGGPPSAGIDVETGQFGSSRVTASTRAPSGIRMGCVVRSVGQRRMNGERAGNGLTVANDDYTSEPEPRRPDGGAGVVGGGDLHHAWTSVDFRGRSAASAGIYTGIDLDSHGDNTRTVGACPSSPVVDASRPPRQSGFTVRQRFAAGSVRSEGFRLARWNAARSWTRLGGGRLFCGLPSRGNGPAARTSPRLVAASAGEAVQCGTSPRAGGTDERSS